MKKLLLAATALSLMAAPAFAQSGPSAAPASTATVNITGWVNASCTAVTGGPFALNNISGATPGSLSTDSFTSTAIPVTCNGANTTVTVEAEPLKRTGTPITPPAGFTTTINYTATLGMAPGGVTQATTAPTDTSAAGGPGTTVLVGLTNGNFNLVVSALNATGLVVAGSYAGDTKVVVTPGV